MKMKLRSGFVRIAADARHSIGLTQEDAAELLGVAVSTLKKYESGDLNIPPDVVTSMSLAYHRADLTRLYCENTCPIGKCEKPCVHDASIERLLLELLVTDEKQLSETIKDLYEIVADGIITGAEKPALDRSMQFLEDLSTRITSLTLKLKTMEAQSQH